MVNIDKIDRPAKWTRNKTCGFAMSDTLADVLKNSSIQKGDDKNWDVYFPCTYDNTFQEIKAANPTKKHQRIFIVNNGDEITAKNSIWKNLVHTYGRAKATEIMPLTYQLMEPSDMDKFKKEYKPDKIYILKKNIQRQEGLLITRDKNKILNAKNEGYVIVQELLQDPYTISGRKINMRFYLLLVCKDNSIDAYVYDDGFMYYTRKAFIKNSTESDHNITTGYIDRSVYKTNPLTHSDLKTYLDNHNRRLNEEEERLVDTNQQISTVVFNRIYKLLEEVVNAVKHTVCIDSHLKNYITFQLFGVDVSISDKLVPQLMEVNKGPDTGCKDERDCKVKKGMVKDIFKVLKIIPEDKEPNGFIKIVE